MKAIVAAAVLALASCSTAPQQEPVGPVHVTSETIASQPAGRAYVIDLTHSGTVYDVAPGIDDSRVRVRISLQADLTMDKFVGGLAENSAASGFCCGKPR